MFNKKVCRKKANSAWSLLFKVIHNLHGVYEDKLGVLGYLLRSVSQTFVATTIVKIFGAMNTDETYPNSFSGQTLLTYG